MALLTGDANNYQENQSLNKKRPVQRQVLFNIVISTRGATLNPQTLNLKQSISLNYFQSTHHHASVRFTDRYHLPLDIEHIFPHVRDLIHVDDIRPVNLAKNRRVDF